ncbi:MAG: alpha/beta fold hydrolase [Candidatus Paceibacterota bacterium]
MGRQAKIVITAIVLILAIIVGWRLLTCGSCRSVVAKVPLSAKSKNMEKVSLVTIDNIKIASDYYPAEGEKGIILVHQFGRDKNSWGDLPALLQKAELSVLAIDLRGHGESDLEYQNFTDLDFNNMAFDLEAGQTYLKQQGKTSVDLIGSSIGANLSLIEKGKNPPTGGGFAKVVALSPGLNFKGLDAEKGSKAIAAQSLKNKEVLLIASADDVYSYDSLGILEKIIDGAGELLTYQTGGHGVALFSSQSELKTKIINFLNN